jgi:hypothetical protein
MKAIRCGDHMWKSVMLIRVRNSSCSCRKLDYPSLATARTWHFRAATLFFIDIMHVRYL